MLADAPQIFIALEQSGLGAAIRQSAWAYPVANVGHILSLVILAGAVAVMDLRLLGAFAATIPATVIWPARRVAIAALGVQVLTGLVLFTAEASHLVMNPVFLVKMLLVGLAVVNALVVDRMAAGKITSAQAYHQFDPLIRTSAGLSLITWILVAMLGRLIAYA